MVALLHHAVDGLTMDMGRVMISLTTTSCSRVHHAVDGLTMDMGRVMISLPLHHAVDGLTIGMVMTVMYTTPHPMG